MASDNPLFCVRVKDKKSERTLYVNFFTTNQVPPPEVEITEDGLIREMCGPNPGIEDYKVPLQASPIFWGKERKNEKKGGDGDNGCKKDYVIDVRLNDRFVYRKVISSLIIRNYVISVTLSVIMDKFNDPPAPEDKAKHQYLGHKLDLDQPNYKILDDKQKMERSNEIVTNKIVIVESDKELAFDDSAEETKMLESDEPVPYDLHLRPAMKILTCSISTEKMPKSIGFNDDRIQVVMDANRILDIDVPVVIDLTVPVKYKFDDRLCLFRMVFSIKEEL